MARFSWTAGLATAAIVAATVGYAAMTTLWQPPLRSGTTLEAYLDAYLTHRAAQFDLDRLANIVFVVGILGLGSLVLARFGSAAFGAGAVVVALAQVAYIGAAERILAVRDVPGFDPATLTTMLDVADRVDDLIECLGLLLIAVGVESITARTARRWQRLVDGIFMVSIGAVIVTTLARSPLTDASLIITGALALPLWTIRLIRSEDARNRLEHSPEADKTQ